MAGHERDSMDSLKRILALSKEREAADAELRKAESQVKLCRRAVDKANERVFEAIEEETQPSLFSAGVTITDDDRAKAREELSRAAKEEAEANERARQVEATARAQAAQPAPAVDPEAWRTTGIDVLKLPPGIAQTLAARGFATLGQLADHKKAGKSWTDIEGVTEAAGRKLEAVIGEHFSANPVPAAGPVEASPEPEAKPSRKKRSK